MLNYSGGWNGADGSSVAIGKRECDMTCASVSATSCDPR